MNKFVEKYGQILLPLITPYDGEENVNYACYEELIDYVIKNDLCDSLIVTGTTGEASLLTFDERVKLMAGQISVDYKKPQDSEKLFVNLYGSVKKTGYLVTPHLAMDSGICREKG